MTASYAYIGMRQADRSAELINGGRTSRGLVLLGVVREQLAVAEVRVDLDGLTAARSPSRQKSIKLRWHSC
jgi:hypothetical protein